ncbi:MAG: hypothetical protein ACJAY5_001942 [Actinomycetes bacterium]
MVHAGSPELLEDGLCELSDSVTVIVGVGVDAVSVLDPQPVAAPTKSRHALTPMAPLKTNFM